MVLFARPVLTGQHTATVYLKANTPGDIGKTITFWMNNGSTRNSTDIVLTGSWTRVTMTNTYVFAGNVDRPFNIGFLAGSSSDTSVAFDVWGAQLESGTSATAYAATGPLSATTISDYRHLRFVNGTDWLCTR